MNTKVITILIVVTAAVSISAAALIITTVNSSNIFTLRPADAQIPDKDNGASGFAPGQEAERPTTCAACAVDFAPGQEAERPTQCAACVVEFTPGDEGLKAGIIGPDLKK
jgi:hypothetical protein